MRNLFLLFFVSLVFIITACGGNDGGNAVENDTANNNGAVEQNDVPLEDELNENDGDGNDGSINVEKNLFNVVVTVPAFFFEGEDPEQIKAEAEQEEGIGEVVVNDDGSLTYKMSKAKHRDMVKEFENQLVAYMDEIKNDEEYVSIQDVEANKSFDEFTIVVDKNAYENSFDGFAAFGLGFNSMFYQLFDGVDQNEIKATIHVKDSETNEVFHTIVYPDDLE